jgi:hypothetical protein
MGPLFPNLTQAGGALGKGVHPRLPPFEDQGHHPSILPATLDYIKNLLIMARRDNVGQPWPLLDVLAVGVSSTACFMAMK